MGSQKYTSLGHKSGKEIWEHKTVVAIVNGALLKEILLRHSQLPR